MSRHAKRGRPAPPVITTPPKRRTRIVSPPEPNALRDKTLHLLQNGDLIARARAAAEAGGISLNRLVELAIMAELEKREEEASK